MNGMEHGMTSHKVLPWPRNESLAHHSTRPSPWKRLKYELRVRWKEALVALTFWTVYSYLCMTWMSR